MRKYQLALFWWFYDGKYINKKTLEERTQHKEASIELLKRSGST